VWEYDAKEDDWRPTLVILRINRAATAVKWSPNGHKFAVASGAKCVPICHYEKGNNWWISKMIKNHKSTVTSVAWAPNSLVLATGCTDYKARLHSAFIEELDGSADGGWESMFPKLKVFGEQLAEYGNSKGWVNSVAFAPSGLTLAFSGQGSTIHFGDLKSGSWVDINQQGLPYLDGMFVNDDSYVAVGYDCNPTLYTRSGDKWVLSKQLDSADKKTAKGPASSQQQARQAWQQADSRGQGSIGGGEPSGEEPSTRHTNAITGIRRYTDREITTCALDGRILFWNV